MSMIIGIAGTAKNTGKTTTLNALLQEIPVPAESIGLTGIGYDGEDIDNITGLPKPRVIVHKGMIVSTSVQCLPASGWSLVQRTGFSTAIGEIVIARCEKTGPVLLAGPNKKNDLRTVTRMISDLGAEMIMVDGALNRIVPMSIADRIILTTGAARNVDINVLGEETTAIERIFQFPQTDRTVPAPSRANHIIHSDDDIENILYRSADDVLVIDGVISSRALLAIKEKVVRQNVKSISSVVFDNPVNVLLIDTPHLTMKLLDEFLLHGISIRFRNTIELSAVTVNPFYPEYRGAVYSSAHVDATKLYSLMTNALSTPVFDIMQNGSVLLWLELQKNRGQK